MENQMVGRARVEQIRYIGLRPWAAASLIDGLKAVVPIGTLPAIQQQAVTDIASVMAANAFGSSLHSLKVVEACGRVVLVSAVPYRQTRDPVLPLAMIHTGNGYDRAFAQYAQHLARFTSDSRWWNQARAYCDAVLYELEKIAARFSVQELAYLVVKLQVPLAWPHDDAGGNTSLALSPSARAALLLT